MTSLVSSMSFGDEVRKNSARRGLGEITRGHARSRLDPQLDPNSYIKDFFNLGIGGNENVLIQKGVHYELEKKLTKFLKSYKTVHI